MLLTNSVSNVWRGRGRRQRREGASLGVSLSTSVRLSFPRISILSADPKPLLLCLTAAGGHRSVLPRLSGVSSPVSREPGTPGLPTPHTAKVPRGHRWHWFSVSFAARCGNRSLVRPQWCAVSQVERTRRGERWAPSVPRTEAAPGCGAAGPGEPLLWAHRHRDQLWKQANVSYTLLFTTTFMHLSRGMTS